MNEASIPAPAAAGEPPPAPPAAATPGPSGGRASIVKNTAALVAGQIVTTAIAIVANAILARTVGAEDFGIYWLVGSIVSFAYVVIDWGPNCFVGTIAREPGRTANLFGSKVLMGAALATIGFGVVNVATVALGYEPRVRGLIALAFALNLVTAWCTAASLVLRARERMSLDAIGSVALGACTAVGIVAAVLAGGGLASVFIAQGVAAAAALTVYAMLLRKLPIGRVRPTAATVRELAHGGTPFVVFAVIVAVHPYVDATLLSKLAPKAVMGWYGAATKFSGTLLFPALVLGSSLYPTLSRLAVSSKEEFSRTVRMTLRPLLTVATLATVGTILFADVAVNLVYGQRSFGGAIVILQSLAPWIFLTFVSVGLGSAVVALRRERAFTVAKVASVVVSGGLDLVLIPWFQEHHGNGAVGTALAQGGSELVMVVTALLLMPRGLIDRGVFGSLVRALASGGGMLAAGWGLSWLGANVVIRLGASLLVFAALTMATGLLARRDLLLLRDMFRARKSGGAASVAVVATE